MLKYPDQYPRSIRKNHILQGISTNIGIKILKAILKARAALLRGDLKGWLISKSSEVFLLQVQDRTQSKIDCHVLSVIRVRKKVKGLFKS